MQVKSLISSYNSPLGSLSISTHCNSVINITFGTEIDNNCNSTNIEKITTQLDEFFTHKRQNFDLEFSLNGTDFQRKVWQTLLEIPYGKTVTYGYIANKIGHPKAARAVGMACNKNPLMIIIPCHRVFGANNAPTGYAGGLLKKQWLVEHEEGISAKKSIDCKT